MSNSLGTARWATEAELYQLSYNRAHRGKDADIVLGLAEINVKYGTFDTRFESHFIAGRTDQHALICMGPRAGKGTSILVPNLVWWQGSCVVIDPKGENATVTANRRGSGSKYAIGMGQKVYVLDPFNVAQVGDEMRARFNPLQELITIINGPRPDDAVDAAGQIADAIIVQDNDKEAFWQESARYLIKGLILHVLTAPEFEGRRNLVTVRTLLVRGDWIGLDAVRRENHRLSQQGEETIAEPDPFALLWLGMAENEDFDGIVSGVGSSFQSMADKERGSVLSTANRQTEFIESPAMRRSLEASDFRLSDLKTDPQGISIYLSLPTRYMGTHFRWLRMFITLMLDEMERIAHQPKCGYPVLMILDEFAGLRRMRRIEDATAQIPGYGVKLTFVIQSLTQLKEVYKDNWETFVTSSGIRVFAANEDPFTLRYLSQRLGQREIIRTVHSSGGGSSSSNSSNYQADRFFSTGSNTSYNSNTSYGTSEQLHKRALMSEDELALTFSANSNLSLAMVPGLYPAQLIRMQYYKMPAFEACYDPHPDHPYPPTLEEWQKIWAQRQAQEAKPTSEQKPTATSTTPAKPSPFGVFLSYCTLGAILGLIYIAIYMGIYYFGYLREGNSKLTFTVLFFLAPAIFEFIGTKEGFWLGMRNAAFTLLSAIPALGVILLFNIFVYTMP